MHQDIYGLSRYSVRNASPLAPRKYDRMPYDVGESLDKPMRPRFFSNLRLAPAGISFASQRRMTWTNSPEFLTRRLTHCMKLSENLRPGMPCLPTRTYGASV